MSERAQREGAHHKHRDDNELVERTSKLSRHCASDLDGGRLFFLLVNIPVGKLGWVKNWDLGDGNVRAKIVILTNIRTAVRLGDVVQERCLSCKIVKAKDDRCADVRQDTGNRAAVQMLRQTAHEQQLHERTRTAASDYDSECHLCSVLCEVRFLR